MGNSTNKLLFLFFNLLLALLNFPTVKSTSMQEKSEAAAAAVPPRTLSPPEGNTTFLGGTSWCVARPGAPPVDLQVALDWACGMGKADCGPIRAGGPCFEPNTLLAHASFAFNSYYQENGNNDIACYFGGTAALTRNDPSFARCMFSTSEPLKASAAAKGRETSNLWKTVVIILLLVR